MTLNIGRDNSDASYRYKMPVLKTKIEGRGNGIKTILVNMSDVAKALQVDPDYPTKYFGFELGAHSKYTAKDDRAVVNGAHTAVDLSRMLERFIETFVLCPRCKLPEVNWECRKGTIKTACRACGNNAELATAHKLKSYILKHPPAGAVTEDVDETKKKKKKGDGKSKESSDEEEAEKPQAVPAVQEVVWTTDTSKEAQRARMAAEFSELVPATNNASASVEAILAAAKKENKAETPGTVLKLYLAGRARLPSEIAAELNRLQLARGLDETQRIKVLLEGLINLSDVKTVAQQFSQHANVFKEFATDKSEAGILMACIEELVGVIEPKLLPRLPMILQSLYDGDVLEEDWILGWHSSPPEMSWLVNKAVAVKARAKATPFIAWLKSAEED